MIYCHLDYFTFSGYVDTAREVTGEQENARDESIIYMVAILLKGIDNDHDLACAQTSGRTE